MIDGKRLVVVMPAYNAVRTLRRTYEDLPHDIVDEVIVVDDASNDDTAAVARELGLTVIVHERNLGYGANQKTCYTAALDRGADIVVMVHPDYQYSPKLCGPIAWMIASGEYDVVLASRILGNGALDGGMPVWKYVANRALTLVENLVLGAKLSEYHTGYRAFSREVLEALPLHENSNDFVFDNQMIAQALRFDFRVGEISCPTRYEPESSSINFRRSCTYGFGVLGTSLAYRLDVLGVRKSRLFARDGRRLEAAGPQPPARERAARPSGPDPGPSLSVLPLLVFLASAIAQVARRPDLFAIPQFFAEDGIFYADAHNLGAFAPLFSQSNGYLQLLPRLVAALAQAAPVATGPVLMLAAGVCVNALPAAFLVSSRMRVAIPSIWARLLLAALYIAIPGVTQTGTVLTYSQWHLSILALMVVLAARPARPVGELTDSATIVLSGLSGPYSILLAPIAAIHSMLRPSPRALGLTTLLGLTAVVQAATLLTVGLAARATTPRGATPFRFLRVVGGRIFYGATAGHTLQALELPLWERTLGNDRFIAAVGAAGLVLLALAFWRGTHELRMFLLFGGAIVAAVLVSASAPSDGPPQWVVLRNQDVLSTYFIVPILCVYAACVWMLGRSVVWRVAGVSVLALAAIFAIPRDWRDLPVDDLDYPSSVRAYDEASPGTSVEVPIPPRPWQIELLKPQGSTTVASGR